jgi:hypothetical protein
MAKATVGLMTRVPRPRLSPEQVLLQAKYQPTAPCGHCKVQGYKSYQPEQAYLLAPTGGIDDGLRFSCVTCGFYTTVKQPSPSSEALIAD